MSRYKKKTSKQQRRDAAALFDYVDQELNPADQEPPPYEALPIPSGGFRDPPEPAPFLARIYEMQAIQPAIAGQPVPFAARVDQFLRQAAFMADFEDNYGEDFPCYSSCLPTYAAMTLWQLRTYFTWRTRVRRGCVNKTSHGFVHIYIYELINLIGARDAEDAFRQLANFWLAYRRKDSRLEPEVKIWLKDFYLHHDLALSFRDLVEKYGLRPLFEDIFLDSWDDLYQQRLLDMSDYPLDKSRFVEKDINLLPFIKKCFGLALSHLDPLMRLHNTSLKELAPMTIQKHEDYRPFRNAIFALPSPGPRRVTISRDEDYHCSGGTWCSSEPCFAANNRSLPLFFGYIVKNIEAQLRSLSRYAYNLSPNIYSVADKIAGYCSGYQEDPALIRIVQDHDFANIITETAAACFAQSPSFDVSRIDESSLDVPLSKSIKIADQELWAALVTMRSIKKPLHAERPHARQFCRQAEALRHQTDTYGAIAEMDVWKISFEKMNIPQIRTYLTWRTRYLNQTAPAVPYAYIILYAQELINNTDMTDPCDKKEIIAQLAALLHAYQDTPFAAASLSQLIRDFYICNPIEDTFQELVMRHGLECFFPLVTLGDDRIKHPLRFYGKLSKYKILQSKFVAEQTQDTLDTCTREVILRVKACFANQGIDFRKALLTTGPAFYDDYNWQPLQGFMYDADIPIRKSVRICAEETYGYSSYRWKRHSYAVIDTAAAHLLGFILKKMEMQMRRLMNFKPKLTLDPQKTAQKIPLHNKQQSKIVRLITQPEFGRLIDQAVMTALHQPLRVRVDFGKLDQIRQDAADIQKKLELPSAESPAAESPQAKSLAPEPSAYHPLPFTTDDKLSPKDDTEDEWNRFGHSLSLSQQEALTIILSEQSVSGDLQALANRSHLLMEVMLEAINETALEHIGDTIVDTGNMPVSVYEDYRKDVRRLLETLRVPKRQRASSKQ